MSLIWEAVSNRRRTVQKFSLRLSIDLRYEHPAELNIVDFAVHITIMTSIEWDSWVTITKSAADVTTQKSDKFFCAQIPNITIVKDLPGSHTAEIGSLSQLALQFFNLFFVAYLFLEYFHKFWEQSSLLCLAEGTLLAFLLFCGRCERLCSWCLSGQVSILVVYCFIPFLRLIRRSKRRSGTWILRAGQLTCAQLLFHCVIILVHVLPRIYVCIPLSGACMVEWYTVRAIVETLALGVSRMTETRLLTGSFWCFTFIALVLDILCSCKWKCVIMARFFLWRQFLPLMTFTSRLGTFFM